MSGDLSTWLADEITREQDWLMNREGGSVTRAAVAHRSRRDALTEVLIRLVDAS